MTSKNEPSAYLTRLDGVVLEEKERNALLALAESVDDIVSRGAAVRLRMDGMPWSFDTLRALYGTTAQVKPVL